MVLKTLPFYRYNKGFTLIEVLLAVTILAFGLTYISESFFVSIAATAEVRNRIAVDSLVSNHIWEMKRFINQNNITDTYSREIYFTEPFPDGVLNAEINQMPGVNNLFLVKIRAAFKEERKNKVVEKNIFFHKTIINNTTK